MRKLIAIAAAAALFCSPALAAPVWAPSQGGTVGANVACKNVNGDDIRCIQPSVTLNDATGAAMGTAGNPVVVSSTATPSVASFTDKSGTVAAGGTSQTLATVNASRKRIVIENPCTATTQGIATAESLFINWTTAASTSVGSSVELGPCGAYDSQGGPVSGEQVNVTAATISHKFIAKEQ